MSRSSAGNGSVDGNGTAMASYELDRPPSRQAFVPTRYSAGEGLSIRTRVSCAMRVCSWNLGVVAAAAAVHSRKAVEAP